MNGRSRSNKIQKSMWLLGALLVVALILAACSPAATATPEPTMPPAPTATTAPQPTATPAPTVAPTAAVTEATINVATDPKYGKILVDGKGMTLYMFTKDEPGKSNCAAGCLKAWPPLLTLGSPTLGDGVDSTLIGTADLADGTKIVTYNKMPLYYFAKDAKPGDITGLGVSKAWYFVSPAGKVVGLEASLAVATDPKYGKILVDGKGMTLYMFTKDAPDKSNCSGGCLKAWPPLITYGAPTLGDGVDSTMVGSTDLADGSKIVTYNHMPLYYWAKDTKPGDITGLGVSDAWYLVSPDGKVVGQPAASTSSSVTVAVATNATLGKILVDGKGMTLYIFTKDAPDKSNCSANCLKAWPPLLTDGNTMAGDGVDKTLLGTATLADGTKIVTYNHMPLYYWAGDTKAGDATGQGNNSVWYVVGPDGKSITTAPSGYQ